MMEYAKTVLWGVSFWKQLFKKELTKIISWSDSLELLQLKKYCYDKYYDMYPDVIDEAFIETSQEYVKLDFAGGKASHNYNFSGFH